jgi:hypothetical protein
MTMDFRAGFLVWGSIIHSELFVASRAYLVVQGIRTGVAGGLPRSGHRL